MSATPGGPEAHSINFEVALGPQLHSEVTHFFPLRLGPMALGQCKQQGPVSEPFSSPSPANDFSAFLFQVAWIAEAKRLRKDDGSPVSADASTFSKG